jgi:hypothetical protein
VKGSILHPNGGDCSRETVRFGPSCAEAQAKPQGMGGGRRGRTRPRRGGGQEHPPGAGGGGVEQRVRRAVQRRRLARVGHHVQERGTRAEAGDAAALPAVGRPL